MNIKITKASGLVEDLNPDKLKASLVRSGADSESAEDVIEKIIDEIEPYTSTKTIYRLAKKYLRQLNHASGLRYSLKKAIMRLGPSGYPFERYYGELLKHYGYKTETDIVIEGRCVKHEVDVFAVKDNEIMTVECKYHNRPGAATDIKVAMYVYARFRDLGYGFKYSNPEKIFKGWLITNTRFTSDAMQYAQCMGLNIKSWGFPVHDSLEKMIEDKRLYPATMISGIKSGLINNMIKNNIILLKDLTLISISDISKMLSLSEHKAVMIKKSAEDLCL